MLLGFYDGATATHYMVSVMAECLRAYTLGIYRVRKLLQFGMMPKKAQGFDIFSIYDSFREFDSKFG